MTDLEIVYVILAIQAVGMLVTTAAYYIKRLKIEEARSTTLKTQGEQMYAYYDQRLSIEKAKLEQRRNGT